MMKVIKVIVDELPESCRDCDFWNTDYEHYVCEITHKEIMLDPPLPKECPLMELKDNEKIGKFIFTGKGEFIPNKEMWIDP
jgi:hypothetical protein